MARGWVSTVADRVRPGIQFPRCPCPAQNAVTPRPSRATLALSAPATSELQARSPFRGPSSPPPPRPPPLDPGPVWPLPAPASVFPAPCPFCTQRPGHRTPRAGQRAGQSTVPRGTPRLAAETPPHDAFTRRQTERVSTGARAAAGSCGTRDPLAGTVSCHVCSAARLPASAARLPSRQASSPGEDRHQQADATNSHRAFFFLTPALITPAILYVEQID